MRKKARTLVLFLVGIVVLSGAKLKEPNWRQYYLGEDVGKSMPAIAPETNGIYSLAMSSNIDYKQPKEVFEEQVLQYKNDGFLELFYETNSTIPVAYETKTSYQTSLPESYVTGVAAYDQFTQQNNLKFPISNGQWLLNQGLFSRFNKMIQRSPEGGEIQVSNLTASPWGVANSLTPARRDEFLIGLAKIAYGPIESRPIYFETDAYRYAKAIIWDEIWLLDSNGNWYFDHFEYWEEAPSGSNNINDRPGARPEYDSSGALKENNGYIHQKVSDMPPQRWLNSKKTSSTMLVYSNFRGEFVTNPEMYDSPISQTYNKDFWSYVSTNVWELYFFKLLSMGILDYNEAFTDNGPLNKSINVGPVEDSFRMLDSLGVPLQEEYLYYAKTVGGPTAADDLDGLSYPVYAPELGIVLSGKSYSVRDFKTGKIYQNQTGSPVSVLGRNFRVTEGRVEFLGDETTSLPSVQYMANTTMTNLAALRMIERVLRVEEKDMSALEANIISQKYGAKYLSNLSDADRKTVEYLIALGIIDFEQFEEYANLYNILSREFCYTLLYRLANPSARTDFSKVLLTDASSASLGIPDGYNNYQNSVMVDTAGTLDRFIDNKGNMVYDTTDPGLREKPLSIMSSVYVDRVFKSVDGNPIYHVILNIDDPLKYLYRGLPLVMTNYSYFPKQTAQSMSNQGVKPVIEKALVSPWRSPYPVDEEHYKIYLDNMVASRDRPQQEKIAVYSQALQEGKAPPVDYKTDDGYLRFLDRTGQVFGDVVGVCDVSKSAKTGRYFVDISIVADNESAAKAFVMANMQPLTKGLLQESVVTSVLTDKNSLMVDANAAGINNNAVISNDIVLTNDGKTVITGDGAAIKGASLSTGDMHVTINETNMISQSVANSVKPNAAVDTLGSQPIVDLTHKMLNVNNAKVLSSKNNVESNGRVQNFTIAYGKDNALNTSKDYFNLSVADIGDVFYHDTTFQYKTTLGETTNVKGTVVLELVLELPTSSEQHAMISSINRQLSQYELNNWLYTMPDNPQLLGYWNYNAGVVNAILSHMGINSVKIRTGYVYPKITLLVDKVPNKDGIVTLTKDEENQILNNFLTGVGAKLNNEWVNTYVGSSLYNQKLSSLSGNEIANLASQGVVKQGNNFKISNFPSGGYLPATVSGDRPFWAELFFFNESDPSSVATQFFQSRLTLPSIKIYPVIAFDGTHRVYGKYTPPPVGGEGSELLEVPFIITDLNHVYMDIESSRYTYNPEMNTLQVRDMTRSLKSAKGLEVTYGGVKWIVVDETDRELRLVAYDYIMGYNSNGRLLDMKNKADMIAVGQAYVNNIFGRNIDPSIDEKQTYSFASFNTAVDIAKSIFDKTIAEVYNESLALFRYKYNGLSYQKTTVPSRSNENIVFRPYVNLDKQAWNISVDGTRLEWSKRFLGADYKFYSSQNNLILMQDELLPLTSENRVTFEDIEQVDFVVGTLTGIKNQNGTVTVKIKYPDGLVNDNTTINENLLHDVLESYSTPVLTSGNKAFSSMSYAKNKIAEYNKDYPNYKNTLVSFNQKLYVANDQQLQKYNAGIRIEDVAVDLEFDPSVAVIVVKDAVGQVLHARLDSRQDTDPEIVVPKRVSTLAVGELEDVILLGTGQISYQGVDDAAAYFNLFVNYVATMRTQSVIGMLVWYALVLCVVFSLTLVVARLIRMVPILHGWFMQLWESTGIDVLRFMSLTIIKVEEDPPGWGHTLLYSFMLTFVPTLLVALMQGFGINFV